MISYRFGPLWTAEGIVFRLWAPAADSLRLLLGPAQERGNAIEMFSNAEGWWRSEPLAVESGTAYSFLVNGEVAVPDPASRAQLHDVHGPSVLVAPTLPEDGAGEVPEWNGRPWEETVLYEVHVGTAGVPSAETPSVGTPAPRYGTFSGLAAQIPDLARTGITALELMPIADFPGSRNWGYDGVLPFAPDTAYGTPDDLRHLIKTAHRNGLAIWLDVVYNHFGPEGNYLHLYAPQFFNTRVDTPWGAAIDFARPQVRRFFIENALYWINEFRFDGLRLDAVHAIHDSSETHILHELAATVRRSVAPGRTVHLVLENDRNEAAYLGPAENQYTAQWNDDIHHAWHVVLTGESHGYYSEYARDPEAALLTALATGYVRKSETSRNLSPARFISFIQNHDQIGNRAYGERLTTLTDHDSLRAALASMILAPQIPLLFMGEIHGAEEPFQFFCDFGEELASAVREGRRREFGLDNLPDPVAEETFLAGHPAAAGEAGEAGSGRWSSQQWLAWFGQLLDIRMRHLVPLLREIEPGTATGGGREAAVLQWEPGWALELNLNSRTRPLPANAPAATAAEWEIRFTDTKPDSPLLMPPWSVRAYERRL